MRDFRLGGPTVEFYAPVAARRNEAVQKTAPNVYHDDPFIPSA
jgi:hypothetical protein